MSPLLLLAALQVAPERLPGRLPNPSFERDMRGWRSETNVAGYRAYGRREASYSSDRAAEGRGWLELDWASRRGTPPDAYFRVTARIDARRYRGRTLAFSAAVRVPDHASGEAALTARVARVGGTGDHERRLGASPAWRRVQLVFPVPRDATSIELGFLIDGRGGELEVDAARLAILPRR